MLEKIKTIEVEVLHVLLIAVLQTHVAIVLIVVALLIVIVAALVVQEFRVQVVAAAVPVLAVHQGEDLQAVAHVVVAHDDNFKKKIL